MTYEGNPAEEGMQAAKEDAKKLESVAKLCDDFKAFCIDAVKEGHGEGKTQCEFLEICLETYVELNEDI